VRTCELEAVQTGGNTRIMSAQWNNLEEVALRHVKTRPHLFFGNTPPRLQLSVHNFHFAPI